MCYSGEMSLGFALAGIAMAAFLRYCNKPGRISVACLYFSAMELLQTVQYRYLAEPEDGYAMCSDPMNQFLTFLGYLHIWGQPIFCNYFFTGMPRQGNLKARIESDLIQRLCVMGALFGLVRYGLAAWWLPNPSLAATPSKECPNYEWVRAGYDGLLGFESPNLPGHSCTFRSASESGHLAWAVPLYQPTYFVPGAFLHAFLMFAPMFARSQNLFDVTIATIFFVSGPVLAAYLTASLHEQASIWCFFSMFQCILGALSVIFEKSVPPDQSISHPGSLGEEPLVYTLAQIKTNGVHKNGHANKLD